jgi:biopolymer transport protein ExbB
LFELFFKGGWVMYPILVCSLLSWSVILERCWFYFSTRTGRGGERFDRLRTVFEASGHLSPADRERALRLEASPFLRRDDRGLSVLAAIAALGPLLGLFGTVLGMIELFRTLALTGARPEFSAMVGGIWTALLTTAFGLVAALPALAAHQTFDKLAARRAESLEEFAHRLELP